MIGENEFSITILVVENDPLFQRYFARAINQIGYEYIIADTSSEALQILEERRVSIVISNTLMPGFDGSNLLGFLNKKYPQIDVIVIVSFEENITLTEVINGGAVDYLNKPFSVDEIRAKLSRVVRERKLIHELVVENKKRLQTEEELRSSHENLERRVHDRTKELEAAKLEAEEAISAQSEFMANISHELRTPMHGILSFASLGVNKADQVSKERLSGYFEEIGKSGNRLLRLLNNLLDLSKFEAEMMHYNMSDNSLLEVVDSAVEHYEALAEEKRLRFEVKSDLRIAHSLFDRQKILQVLLNLLNNAIKYTDVGSTIEIKISGKEDISGTLDSALVTISDNGIGIPLEELDSVFDKFKQSSRTRSGAGGTGLGLAICKQIILAHKGKIWAENRMQGGTQLCFTLPLNCDVS